MNKIRLLRWSMILAVGGGLLFAASPRAIAQMPKAHIRDVALGEGGTLEGVVIDAQGVPKSGSDVVVRRGDRIVGRAKTDRLGHFKIRGLPGGMFHVSSSGAGSVFRLWKAGTSPPSAKAGVLIVCLSDYLRGQYTPGAVFSSNGLLFAGLVIATVAIPVVVSSSRIGS
jgi:hypothetical protein